MIFHVSFTDPSLNREWVELIVSYDLFLRRHIDGRVVSQAVWMHSKVGLSAGLLSSPSSYSMRHTHGASESRKWALSGVPSTEGFPLRLACLGDSSDGLCV
uniref:Uncharacterized protein n=1 Tax=Heterorhabditis bacteriophora TaxID=37862 RepID=A0A1I7WE98_HETBA